MNIVDIIILLFIIAGGIFGFKRGAIKQAAIFGGTLGAFILAFSLKNPLAMLMYKNLPFFPFHGFFKGVTILNILVYEVIAYLIILSLLFIAVKLIKFLSGFIEKILEATVILGPPSKIIGAIIGLFFHYIIVFALLFIIKQPVFNVSALDESKYADPILTKTPIINYFIDDRMEAIGEITSLKEKYETIEDKNELNLEALDILLKYDIITVDAVENLVASNKIDIDNINTVLEKYKGE